MKIKSLFALPVALLLLALTGCGSHKAALITTDGEMTAEAWYNAGSWRHGFTPQGFDGLDVATFYDQYQKNPAMYDSIFTWLASIDPVQIAAGKSVMTWSHALANVQDLELRPTEKCRIEQHRDHIDLQWDVTGTERYGLVRDTTLLEPINQYKPDVQNFKCRTDFRRIDSAPDRFFLFFPSDYHQACEIATQPETVRKIVVKIEYIR
jgi:YhcH/YjgK/YiaL family protein